MSGEPVSTLSDVYSLGAVLYEMLTGRRPHQLALYDALEIARQIREQEVPAPSVVAGPELRGDLDVIVIKALQKDPARRYHSVDQFAEDVRRYLGRTIVARPDTLAYRTAKFVRRHRLGLAALAAVFLALVSGVAVSAWQAMRANQAGQAARLERDRATSAQRAATQERDRARSAEQTATRERNRALAEKQRADTESATVKAINEFLQDDLLAQAGASTQSRPGTVPDPDLKVRTALDRAGASITGKFATKPLVEASIRQTIGNSYKDLGLLAEAQKHIERAFNLRLRALGEAHPETLESMSATAGLYLLRGKLRKLNLCLERFWRSNGERRARVIEAP